MPTTKKERAMRTPLLLRLANCYLGLGRTGWATRQAGYYDDWAHDGNTVTPWAWLG